MSAAVVRFIACGIFVSAALLPLTSKAETSAATTCTVPKRLHLQAIILGTVNDDPKPVLARVQREGYDAVAKSMPENAADVGWFTPGQLQGSDYAPAATLAAGESVADESEYRKAVLHVAEVRPAARCDAAIAAYPNDTWPLDARGNSELQAGAYAKAEADYSKAVAVDPKDYDAYLERSSARYSLGKYQGAKEDAEHATESNQGMAYTMLARAQEALGEDVDATQSAGRALAQLHGNEQNEGPARLVLGGADADLGYSRAAVDEYTRAIAALPHEPTAFIGRGGAYFALGDFARARSDFEATQRIAPTWSLPPLDLALVDFSQNRFPSAIANARHAAVLSPGWEYPALWVAVIQRAMHTPITVHPGGTAWPAPVLRAYTGHASFASLHPIAPASDALTYSLERCEIDVYHGLYERTSNPKQYRSLLLKARAECPAREMELSVAKALLKTP